MVGDHSYLHHPRTLGCGDCRNEISEHALLQDQPGFPAYMTASERATCLNRVTASAKESPAGRHTKESKK